MAIIIEQQSECPICNTHLDENKEYLLIPPLIGNTKDSLFICSDSGIHVECLNRYQLKDKLLMHVALYDASFPLSKQKCGISGNIISNPINLLFFGLLTSDETEELYNFNYLSFDITNINKWADRNKFISVTKQFLFEEKWESLTEFNKLEYILNKIKNC